MSADTKWIATDDAVVWFEKQSSWKRTRLFVSGVLLAPLLLLLLAVDLWIQGSYDDERNKEEQPK